MAARRAPDPERRQRDPERARERLLEAAAEEFGAKGFSGARIREIAARAGLNQQLISYYFGGKAGLYEALQRRWRERSGELGDPGRPLEDVVADFYRAGAENRPWARLLAWQGLADGAGGEESPPEDSGLMGWMAEELKRRQKTGELAAGLDPGYTGFALFALAAAPVVLPQIARGLTGADPDSPEFQRAYAEELVRLVRRLRD
jgi:AcrR family transcriptional regulator